MIILFYSASKILEKSENQSVPVTQVDIKIACFAHFYFLGHEMINEVWKIIKHIVTLHKFRFFFPYA